MSASSKKVHHSLTTVLGGTKEAVVIALVFLLASILTVLGIRDLQRLCNGSEPSSSVCQEAYQLSFTSQGAAINDGHVTKIPASQFYRWSSAFQIFVVMFLEILVLARRLPETKVALLAMLGLSTILTTISMMGLVKHMMIWGAKIAALGLSLHTFTNSFLIFRIESLETLMLKEDNDDDDDVPQEPVEDEASDTKQMYTIPVYKEVLNELP